MSGIGPKTGFRRATVRVSLAAMLTAFLPSALFAQTDEDPRWFGDAYDDKAVLSYGVPDSYVMLYFSCPVGARVVTVHVQDEESRATAGAVMHVRLAAGGEAIAFSGKAMPNEDSGGKDVTGRLRLDDRLRHLLTARDRLEIVVDGHVQRYDMSGAAEPAVAMLAACEAPAPVAPQ